MKISRERWALIEALGFNFFALFCIWCGERVRPTLFVIIGLLIGICIASNRYHHDSLERIGLRWKNFRPMFNALMPMAVPVIIALYAVAWFRGMHSLWSNPLSYVGYPVWAFAQDYALLGFVGNRFEDAMPNRRGLVPWVNGFFFALIHLPNPILTVTTFIGGVIFTYVFLRRRHLLPVVIVHALVGAGLTIACYDVRGILSIGPAYLERIGIHYN